MSDAIVLTSQQPGDPRRARRSSAPMTGAEGSGALEPAQSLIPAGFHFEGSVAFHGRARIDGRVVGPIEGRGRLEIGVGAEIEGDVRADELIVAGRIVGDVTGSSRVELRPEARVQGSLRTIGLVMHEGAILDGDCATGSAASDGGSSAGSAA